MVQLVTQGALTDGLLFSNSDLGDSRELFELKPNLWPWSSFLPLFLLSVLPRLYVLEAKPLFLLIAGVPLSCFFVTCLSSSWGANLQVTDQYATMTLFKDP